MKPFASSAQFLRQVGSGALAIVANGGSLPFPIGYKERDLNLYVRLSLPHPDEAQPQLFDTPPIAGAISPVFGPRRSGKVQPVFCP